MKYQFKLSKDSIKIKNSGLVDLDKSVKDDSEKTNFLLAYYADPLFPKVSRLATNKLTTNLKNKSILKAAEDIDGNTPVMEINKLTAKNFRRNFQLNHIYDYEKEEEFSDFQFISSWENNYKSWQSQKEFPLMIVKYEDLMKKTYEIFTEIVKFINHTTNNSQKINKLKIKNSVNSTSFQKLKDNEIKYGFSESVKSRKKNKQIPFFFLGPENDWEKILEDDLKEKLNLFNINLF